MVKGHHPPYIRVHVQGTQQTPSLCVCVCVCVCACACACKMTKMSKLEYNDVYKLCYLSIAIHLSDLGLCQTTIVCIY